MRVTNRMLVDTVINNLHRNVSILDQVQRQISSGKRVTRPADDPAAAALGVRIRAERASDNQYLRNIEQATTWLETTDQALMSMGNSLSRLRELGVQASNGSYTWNDRQAMAREARQLREHLVSTLNSTVQVDQYVFGGYKTSSPPFSIDAQGTVRYLGDSNAIAREIGPGSEITVNVTGDTFMQVFADIDLMVRALEADGSQNIPASITRMDKAIDTVLLQRTEVGGKLNRLTFTLERMQRLEVEVGRLQSVNEDLDFADAITRLTTQQGVYRAALEAGARTAPMSILDFLR